MDDVVPKTWRPLFEEDGMTPLTAGGEQLYDTTDDPVCIAEAAEEELYWKDGRRGN